MTVTHGLVIGKFYPPHAGHHLLVRTAARTCRQVTVVVMAAFTESIPLLLFHAALTYRSITPGCTHVSPTRDC